MTDLLIRRTYEPLKFLGRLFWVPLKVDREQPKVFMTHTWEADGSHWARTLVVRLPFGRGLGLGVWQDVDRDSIVPVHEDEIEFDRWMAVNGDEVTKEQFQALRRHVAGMGMDPEEEMLVLQEMGIMVDPK